MQLRYMNRQGPGIQLGLRRSKVLRMMLKNTSGAMAAAKLGIPCRAIVYYAAAAFLLLLIVLPDASARKVQVEPSKFNDPQNAYGLQAQLILKAREGLSASDRLESQIIRSHARANSFGAIISAGSSYDSPMSSVPGGFAMTLTIGSPGQTFTGIADTGSDLVWVQSKPCTSCFDQPDPLFDPSKSSTFKKVTCSSSYCQDIPKQTCNSTGVATCPYVYAYGDTSQTDGILATETITLTTTTGGMSKVLNFVFGSGTNNKGSFQQVDGLVGLGKGPLSLTSQLGAQFSNKFSYCLVPFGSQFATPSPIYFGDAAVPSGSIKYTPFVSNPVHSSFYYVNLEGLSVNGKKLDIPDTAFAIDSAGKGGLLFDSGTTITYLVPAAYQPLKEALKDAVTYPATESPQPDVLDLCYAPGTESPSFPSITFHFKGADYVVPSENAFIAVDMFGQTYCLAMSTSTFPLSIFGNVQQANYHIVYDRANSRLGFSQTQCSSS